MSKDTEVVPLKGQIYERMLLKETNELLEIWRIGDREEWTETALEVAKEILIDRLGEIPPEDERNSVKDSTEVIHPHKLKLLRISSWAKILSRIVLGFYFLVFLGRVVLEIQGSKFGVSLDLIQVWTWLGFLSTPLTGLIYFLVLQAVSEGISALAEVR